MQWFVLDLALHARGKIIFYLEQLLWHITSTHVQHDYCSILNADKLCGMLGKSSLITRNLIVIVEDFKQHGPRMKIKASSYVTANHCVKHINIWVTMLKLENLRFLNLKQMDNGKHHNTMTKINKGTTLHLYDLGLPWQWNFISLSFGLWCHVVW